MKLPFDKIYCLHLSEDKDREIQIKKEFRFLGITKQVEIWWTCKRNISNKIGKLLSTLHTAFYNEYSEGNDSLYGNVFNCSFEHYSIIKQAYLRGFKNILIIEDDILFNRDKEKIKYILNNIPSDYDIIKFFNEFTNDLYNNKPIQFINDKTDLKPYTISSLCYAISRNGMKIYIEEMDKKFRIADVILDELKNNENINFYCLSQNDFCSSRDISHCNSNILFERFHND